MRNIFVLAAIVLSLFLQPLRAEDETCPIFPIPKQYEPRGESWTLADDQRLAIVVADRASETERYGADRLRLHLRRRFGKNVLGNGSPST